MSLLLVDYIETACNSLKSHRSRSILTTLGIAIGIASVTTILALSHGVTDLSIQRGHLCCLSGIT